MEVTALPAPVFCGVDWAEDHHDIALVDAGAKQLTKHRINDDAEGFAQLIALLGEGLAVGPRGTVAWYRSPSAAFRAAIPSIIAMLCSVSSPPSAVSCPGGRARAASSRT
ncbi:IS110 family transposase [Streptomyces scabichelini]|uniref:IS110 family transposase n=1 Tax=Streptomyces scabichelini TaxID=2711217 RepID=UPI0019D0F6A9|nr:transposase [Streptomyces scabichelini]